MDTIFREFVKDVLGAVRQDRGADLYRAIFLDSASNEIERANRQRRAIHGALITYAANHGLSADFSEHFFPQAPSRKKNAPEE